MDDCFTSFHMLTHLGVNNIQATTVLYKNRLCKCTIIGEKQLQKKKTKKRNGNQAALKSAHQAKKQCNFDKNETIAVRFTQLLLNFVNLRNLLSVRTKWKNAYSRARTKSIPLFQPKHGFRQQNGPKPGQVHDQYPSEKEVVAHVCLNGRCCSSRCAGIVSHQQTSSLCLFCVFEEMLSEIFKGRRIILGP